MEISGADIGLFCALGSTATWAVCAVLFKKLGEKLDPIGMTLAKALLSVIFLLPVVIFFYPLNSLTLWQAGMIAVSGILGIAVGDSLFFAALNKLSPLVLAIILLAGPDILTGILGFVFLREMPALPVWIGIALIMISTALLLFPDAVSEKDSVKTSLWGVLLGCGSLVATALAMVIVKPVLVQHSSLPVTMLRMFFGSVSLLIYGAVARKMPVWYKPFASGEYRWGFFGTVALVTYGGFWLSLAAVKYLDLVVASALMSLEPVFVLIFMLLFTKHKTSFREISGLIFAVSGVLLITYFNK